jgi:hypothetical protein
LATLFTSIFSNIKLIIEIIPNISGKAIAIDIAPQIDISTIIELPTALKQPFEN